MTTVQRAGRRLAHLAAGIPTGTATFAVVLTGLLLGAVTTLIWIGLPILAGTLAVARWFAGLERDAVSWGSGRPLPPHAYRDGRALADPQRWRDAVHAIVGFPVLLVTGVLAISWAGSALGLTLYVAWEWALPRDSTYEGLLDLALGIPGRGPDIAANTVLGLVLLATLPPVLAGLTAVRRGLGRALLASSSETRVAASEAGRRSAIAAEASTLRRVERDLHDGPQQRLVRMTMDLEALGRRLDDDPGRARVLLDETLVQSREALAELRSLGRGIAPPVLADRGLEAAVAAAAGRCPVPTTVDVDPALTRRPDPAVETAAYFVVSEALANVAKHARATSCEVEVARSGDTLRVRVRDDGCGGAHPGKGHGLAGLAERVAAVDGALEVRSRPGAGTTLVATFPVERA
ncbi:sensor histidine kinase [Actinomycetospora termitidis]|uniref:histidine kinase n=1 Tax=Actinomycetospora termitidis TaxID=3053470 RepID=A0ABT7MH51_9PSEU|nr:sensor histidine kinase [Actinomycetospora sp. Odt1-22]MDL5159980.1 sensor histidine kinase [Actinomycetospora sp. Odt1-22]